MAMFTFEAKFIVIEYRLESESIPYTVPLNGNRFC
jgi:hypothetical protein